MKLRLFVRTGPVCALAVALAASAAAARGNAADSTLSLDSARVTISGNSNLHPYTASSTTVRVTRARIAAAASGDALLQPGAVEALDIAIPAASLTSPKDGLDKNMHKALKAKEHADITFRLTRLEPRDAERVRAVGTLRIAGVEKEIALDLKTARRAGALAIEGEIQLLMTDFGIAPPKAMLGMLKTDPKVTVRIEAVVGS